MEWRGRIWMRFLGWIGQGCCGSGLLLWVWFAIWGLGIVDGLGDLGWVVLVALSWVGLVIWGFGWFAEVGFFGGDWSVVWIEVSVW